MRSLFQRVPGSVQLLAPLLRSSTQSSAPNQQLLYEAGMCVWQLTFYEPAAEAMGSSGVVQGLVEMARQATKEKVRCHLCLNNSMHTHPAERADVRGSERDQCQAAGCIVLVCAQP